MDRLAPWILIAVATLLALAMIAIGNLATRQSGLEAASSDWSILYAVVSSLIIAVVGSMAYVHLRRADVYRWFSGRTDLPGRSEYLVSVVAGAVLLAVPAALAFLV